MFCTTLTPQNVNRLIVKKQLKTLNSDKLKVAECEKKTLKSFLTSKTAMVERRKKEIQEVRMHGSITLLLWQIHNPFFYIAETEIVRNRV